MSHSRETSVSTPTSERYNEWFVSEAEARLWWGIRCAGLDRQEPFPGDRRPTRTRRAVPSDNLFARVKAAVDIVDLAGRFIKLQCRGRSLVGLCPFHTEKTPSFVVNPERQSWRCFGACGRGGDVIALAQAFMDAGKL